MAQFHNYYGPTGDREAKNPNVETLHCNVSRAKRGMVLPLPVSQQLEKCPDCGAAVGGHEECQKLFDEVIAREFSNPSYFGVHRTTVDCYALQHPKRYCASFKSFAAHLTGLCCAIEYRKDPTMMRAIQVGLDGRLDRTRPAFVENRGEITIESVYRASDAAGHRTAVEAWAASVWRAWSQHHDLARELLREMMKSARSREKATAKK